MEQIEAEMKQNKKELGIIDNAAYGPKFIKGETEIATSVKINNKM